MHNNIMAGGSRDRPPMLAIGRYTQWRSRFLRYIDIRPNGDALRKCILEGPYTPTTVIIQAVPAMDNSPAVPERTTVETVLNMSPENKAHFELEKEAIHLILTGIGDEIYSTVDACKTTQCKFVEAIEKATTSLKSKTSNVNAVCATCGKCVFNLNHDACASKYLNDMNARTKKPKVVPISTRKPKSQENKSVATRRKKIVASESTV
ncbi:hypothetical protein Tco_1082186 [Tanacetum coccineum]|uniref:Integrase, catalytic region, zinc finger, CCHC-type, peptidase aspartic, catalytic n=1 Tax=Tanacetum coccineum TaxID=301880 RepID=A0ABQ5I0U4_9ASTR